MKKTNQIIITAALTLCSTIALAGQVGTLSDFVAGQPAVAAEVNKNFGDIKSQVNDNDDRVIINKNDIKTINDKLIATDADARITALEGQSSMVPMVYDYTKYLSSATTKTFTVVNPTNTAGNCNVTTVSYSFQRTAATNELIKTVTEIDNSVANVSTVCLEKIFTYAQTPTKLSLVSLLRNSADVVRPINTLISYDSPVTVLSSTMKLGKITGDAAIRTNTNNINGSIINSGFVYKATLLEIEKLVTLTVNGVEKNYTDCLIVDIERAANNSVEWLCRGEGVVKSILKNGTYMNLTTTTP